MRESHFRQDDNRYVGAAVFLGRFASLPGGERKLASTRGLYPLLSEMTQFSERYVVIPFINQDENMTPAVFFAATCDSEGCELERRAGYAITNREGSDVKLYIDPRDRELIALVQEFSMSRFYQN